ncbi:LysR family transcriptional regulator [Desulforhopalus sp. 52FAK]
MSGIQQEYQPELNWDDLRIFLALCRHQSFVAAAIELKSSHPTVSRKISALEHSLQTQLFQRTEKGCRLTPAGEKLLPYAEQLESTCIQLHESVAGRNKQLTGIVRICAPDGLGNYFLPAKLIELQKTHPEVEIELLAVPMYYSLSKREVDILITLQKPTAGNIVRRKLTAYKFGLFATAEYLEGREPITSLQDLSKHRNIGYIDDLLFDQDLRFVGEIGTSLTTHFRSSTSMTQMHAVLEGGGIAVLPYFMANQIHSLIPVLPENSIEREFWLQVNPDTRQLARVKTTIDYIVQEVKKNKDLFQSLVTIDR